MKAGKLRLLAHTGTAPIAAFPDVPSFKSLGYDVEYTAWAGLVAPEGHAARTSSRSCATPCGRR